MKTTKKPWLMWLGCMGLCLVFGLMCSGCCLPGAEQISPSSSVSWGGRGRGSADTHWKFVQINPHEGIEYTKMYHWRRFPKWNGKEVLDPLRYLVCRFHGENNWVVKKNDQLFREHRGYWGKYKEEPVTTNQMSFVTDQTCEPSWACALDGQPARFVDLDAIEMAMPELDLVVFDDGKVGFIQHLPHAKKWCIWHRSSFAYGLGDTLGESETFFELIEKLGISPAQGPFTSERVQTWDWVWEPESIPPPEKRNR